MCSLYSSISISFACTAARKRGASPKPSRLTSPETTERTQPAATSHSIGIPCTIATTVRSRTLRRASVRMNAIGTLFIESPPIAIVDPSAIVSAASSRVRSLLSVGGFVIGNGEAAGA